MLYNVRFVIFFDIKMIYENLQDAIIIHANSTSLSLTFSGCCIWYLAAQGVARSFVILMISFLSF